MRDPINLSDAHPSTTRFAVTEIPGTPAGLRWRTFWWRYNHLVVFSVLKERWIIFYFQEQYRIWTSSMWNGWRNHFEGLQRRSVKTREYTHVLFYVSTGVIGSAMTELAYDIASGANFKFNTFFEGSVVSFHIPSSKKRAVVYVSSNRFIGR